MAPIASSFSKTLYHFFRLKVLSCNPHLWQDSDRGQPPRLGKCVVWLGKCVVWLGKCVVWLGKCVVWVQGQYAMSLRKWWQKRYGCLNCVWITGALFQIKLHFYWLSSYSEDLKPPREPWNPMRRVVPGKFPSLAGIVNETGYKTKPIFTGLGHEKLSLF